MSSISAMLRVPDAPMAEATSQHVSEGPAPLADRLLHWLTIIDREHAEIKLKLLEHPFSRRHGTLATTLQHDVAGRPIGARTQRCDACLSNAT